MSSTRGRDLKLCDRPPSFRECTPARLPLIPASSELYSQRNSNYFVGIFLLLAVVVLWTTSSFITNAIETGTNSYDKPFAVTWTCTSFFALYLFKPLASYLWHHTIGRRPNSTDLERSPLLTNISPTTNPEKLTDRETFKLAAFFVVFWFAANYSINAGLSMTSVSSATILSTTSGFFTLFLGHLLGFGTFTILKLFAVALSLTGVIFICTKDNDLAMTTTTFNHRLVGDGLALLSALLYASYVSLLKVTVKDESKIQMTLFFGFVGLLNILCLWPFGVLLHFTGVEVFEWPKGKMLILGLVVNGVITLISDYIYLLAMLKTSPLVVTLGLSLTIPCAIVGDIFENTPLGGWKTVLGAALIVTGFIIVGSTDQAELVEDGRGRQE